MKTLVLSAIAASVLFAAGAASAQDRPLRANERYCLEVRDGSGIHPLLCRFETIAQCMASRNGLTDVCMLNPILAFQQRR